MNALGYAICGIFSQLTSDDLDQWHFVVFSLERWFQPKLGMRPMMASCWSLLKRSKRGGTTSKAVSLKSLCLQKTTNFNTSWIQRAWALNKFGRLKSCQSTTSGLIIKRAKLMKLLMPCHDTPSGVLRKKKPSKLRIQRSCTNCSPCWLECLNWASWE